VSMFVWDPSGKFGMVTTGMDGGQKTFLPLPATCWRRFEWTGPTTLFAERCDFDAANVWRVTTDSSGTAVVSTERLTAGDGWRSGFAVSPDHTRLALLKQIATRRVWVLPFDARARCEDRERP
jgi:hypothetical protein